LGNDDPRVFPRFDLRDLGVLGAGQDPDFDRAATLAARALRTPISTLSVLDFDAGVSRLRAQFGTRVPLSDREVIAIEASLAIKAMSRYDVITIPDVAKDSTARAHPFVRAQGIQSILAAPIMCPAEEVVALIAVHDRIPRIWTRDEHDAILGIAHFCTEIILLRAALRTLGMVSRKARGAV
jgi:GAF domain-containing protein